MNEGTMFDGGAMSFRSTCFLWHLRHPPWGLQWHGQFHCRILLSQKVPAVWTEICKEDGGGGRKWQGKIKPDREKDFLVWNSIHSQLFDHKHLPYLLPWIPYLLWRYIPLHFCLGILTMPWYPRTHPTTPLPPAGYFLFMIILNKLYKTLPQSDLPPQPVP